MEYKRIYEIRERTKELFTEDDRECIKEALVTALVRLSDRMETPGNHTVEEREEMKQKYEKLQRLYGYFM